MTSIASFVKTLELVCASFLFLTVLGAGAMAQVQRTFVSVSGSDGNPCSRAAPCRTFAQAISQTNSGGELIVLDSAGYGPVTISKSISVIAPPGVYAGISVFSGDGITINAGASDTVILRGLTVNDQGGGFENGIVFNSGGTLQVEGCVANGFTSGSGIEVLAPGNIFVKDTIARGNEIGILLDLGKSGLATVAMDQVHLDGNRDGLDLAAPVAGTVVEAAIRNSSVSGNGSGGISALGNSGGTALLDIESCLITNNGGGIDANSFGGTADISISNCTITHNSSHGFDIAGTGVIFSRGNNTIIGNGSNVGSLTPFGAQ
jgi:hypothetical protein